jgi:hypothetical protein
METQVLIHKSHSLLKVNKKNEVEKLVKKVLGTEPENQLAWNIKEVRKME